MRIEHWRYILPLRLRSLFRRTRVEQELDEELQDHLEHKVQEFRARGLSPEQARAAAMREMDGLTQRKEECRDARGVNVVDNTMRDLRYSLRVLAKSPGFTAVAVATLALAIGANSVVFGVMNALILRPLDLPRAESFWGIQRTDEHFGQQSYPDYIDLRDRNRSFENLAAYTFSQASMDAGDNPSRAWLQFLSGNYFDALGIQPYLGRFFHATDERGPNSAPYIVLSYDYWHSRFADDRGVIGRVVRLNRHPYTIIGVTPQEFHGALLFFYPDFYAPMVNQEQIDGVSWLNSRFSRPVFMTLGHLKQGVTTAQAAADLDSIGVWLAANYPKEDPPVRYTLVRPGLFGDFLGRPVRAFVGALMLLAGLILVAACANLGNLFAARAADRGREVALRLALGAGRGRILSQYFTESLMIAAMGGVAGLFGSVVLLRALSVWRPLDRFPIHVPVQPDASVYAIALLLAVISGILFGIVPVRQVLRADPYQVVKAGTTVTIGRRISVRDLLLVVQVAVCALLVTSSVVAVRGMTRSLRGDYGFEPRNVILANTDLNMAGYAADQVAGMQKRMLDAIRTVPGVDSAALVSPPPLDQGWQTAPVFKDEAADLSLSKAATRVMYFVMSPEYLRTAQTKLLLGRDITAHDDKDSPKVGVVNREFARRMFGSASAAVGRYFKLRTGTRVQIVGVVEDGKYTSLTESPKAALFRPILQEPSADTWLAVRSQNGSAQMAGAIRGKLREVDSGLAVFVQTWEGNLQGALFPSRVAAVALGIMGILGAMLAVTGIFGMAAYSVSKRLRELGIRMALGARPRQVLEAGLGRALKLLVCGSGAGIGLGLLSTRVLSAIVYEAEATPRDPLVLVAVVLTMLGLGLVATWIPARRALSQDPMRLLREE